VDVKLVGTPCALGPDVASGDGEFGGGEAPGDTDDTQPAMRRPARITGAALLEECGRR
jgi:hypothetical protein